METKFYLTPAGLSTDVLQVPSDASYIEHVYVNSYTNMLDQNGNKDNFEFEQTINSLNERDKLKIPNLLANRTVHSHLAAKLAQ
ncbi:hypothetical protein JTB14_022231 [Gonioctena quinquepunctata]|nr:hypothetical protein JTB14_022231 [Gonioctena quinquepunctata]